MTADDLRYPVGRFTPVPPTPDISSASVEDIAALPARMRAAVEGLTDPQLDTVEPSSERQAMRRLGSSSTISASHSTVVPAGAFAVQ